MYLSEFPLRFLLWHWFFMNGYLITHHTFFFVHMRENINVSIFSIKKDTGDFSTLRLLASIFFVVIGPKNATKWSDLLSHSPGETIPQNVASYVHIHTLSKNSQTGYPALRRSSAQRKTTFYCLPRPVKHHVSCRNPRILQWLWQPPRCRHR